MFSIDIKEAEPTTPYIRDMKSGEWRVRLPDMKTAEAVMALIEAERERCCQLVFGHASSDNAAQRTVDAIRGKTRR